MRTNEKKRKIEGSIFESPNVMNAERHDGTAIAENREG